MSSKLTIKKMILIAVPIFILMVSLFILSWHFLPEKYFHIVLIGMIIISLIAGQIAKRNVDK